MSDTAVTEPRVRVTLAPQPPWASRARRLTVALVALAVGAAAARGLWVVRSRGPVDGSPSAPAREAPGVAERRRQLQEWSWVDREQNLVRMPIDRAMKLVVDGQR